MATLVIREPDGSSRDVEFDGELTVGRADGSGLVLAEGGVSRRHALLSVGPDGAVWVEDLGSAHGTFLDGAPLEERTQLSVGQSLQIGDYTLELSRPRRARPAAPGQRPVRRNASRGRGVGEDAGDDGTGVIQRGPGGRPRALPAGPSALARRPAGGPEAPRGPHLKGATGPWLNRYYGLRGRMVVGRQEGVGIFVDDASVSRQHAELELSSEGVTVRDLGSANGSALNDQRLGQDPVPLEDGDRLLFGGVEFTYASGAESGRALPVRARPGRLARAGASQLAVGGGEAEPPDRRRLFIVGGSVFGALLLIFVVAAVVKDNGATPNASPQGRQARAAAMTPEQRLKELLSRCRTHASLDLGSPDWAKAEEACNAALDIDPIHEEAVALIKRISVEREAADLFARAERALSRNHEEEALELYQQIPRESGYFRRARGQVTEALQRVTKRLLQDCKVYVRNNKWKEAASACERHMTLACPSIPREQIVPPVGYTLSLRPRRGRNEWKPTNPDFLRFLDARARAGMADAPWECPASEILVMEEDTNTPKKAITAEFNQRHPDKVVQRAMLEYWEGKAGEASALLQRVRNTVEKAPLHAEVDLLKRQVENVFQLYQNGQALLQDEDPERAAPSFEEALAIDQVLMRDPFYKDLPSFYRGSMQKDLAAAAYQRGRFWADRQDPRKGCSVWKLGFRFFSGNIDLNKAVRLCSEMALRGLNAATSCDALPAVMDLAVEGDGVAERAEVRKQELGCL